MTFLTQEILEFSTWVWYRYCMPNDDIIIRYTFTDGSTETIHFEHSKDRHFFEDDNEDRIDRIEWIR